MQPDRSAASLWQRWWQSKPPGHRVLGLYESDWVGVLAVSIIVGWIILLSVWVSV